MKNNPSKIEQQKLELAVADYWSQILKAAGCYSDDYDLGNILLLSGSIIHDRVVSERVQAKNLRWAQNWMDENMDPNAIPDPPTFTVQVLLEMSPADRAMLHERLRRYWQR